MTLTNLSFFGCTFRLRNCTGCRVADLNLTYPSYNRDVHLRDVQPFGSGPPPNITLLEGDGNTLERVAIRYSNTAGLKVVGSHNVLSELLIRDTDWLGTLDYPPLEIGFGNDCDSAEIRKANRSGCRDVPPFPGWSVEAAEEERRSVADHVAHGAPPDAAADPPAVEPPQPAGLRMYPRNPHGTNNSVRRCTVADSGNAGIVTSQLSNEVSYCDVHGVGTIGRDDAGLHADNSRGRAASTACAASRSGTTTGCTTATPSACAATTSPRTSRCTTTSSSTAACRRPTAAASRLASC